MGQLKHYNELTGEWEATIAGAQGPVGPKGDDGYVGSDGLPGIIAQAGEPSSTEVLWLDLDEDGVGVPLGGTAGQVLSKVDSGDFNTEWSTPYTESDALNDISTAVSTKADISHDHNDLYYTKIQSDNLLGDKSDTTHIHDDRYYTESETDTAISSAIASLVDTAPATLDTLNELAAALGDDQNFATTVTTALSGKSDTTHTHDDRYYTESEANTLLNEKASLSGATFTGAISGTSATLSGSVSATQIIGTTPVNSGSTGGVAVKAPASGTQTSAYIQFVNNAYNAQWGSIEATSAGVMNLGASYVRKPSQPSFLAYRPGGNNWGQSSGVLPFFSTRHNIGGHYNTSNYRFTAPVAGTYVFTLHFNVYSASGVIVQAVFGLNGAAAFAGNRFNTAGGDQDATGSLTIYLNAGDYVDPRCYLSSGMTCSSGEYWSHFSGFLLG